MDKQLVYTRANGVPSFFFVTNDLPGRENKACHRMLRRPRPGGRFFYSLAVERFWLPRSGSR